MQDQIIRSTEKPFLCFFRLYWRWDSNLV